MHHVWESPAEGVRRCRLPFLDVTVGAVFGRAGAVLIDCGTTLDEARSIDADIRTFDARGVSHLVLTHWHFDHILGASVFGDAAVFTTPQVVAAMGPGIADVRAHALSYGAAAADIDAAIAALDVPVDAVGEATIDLGDRTVRVEFPGRGHTDHDLIVLVSEVGATHPSVVFCGDLVEESGDPAVSAESFLAEWPPTLDRVLARGGPDAAYVPGHGAIVDAAFVRRQRDALARM